MNEAEKNEIKELAKSICKPCRRDNETNINCICAEPPCSGAINIAKDLYEAGYHKTVWHKIADGDLPNITDSYLCEMKGYGLDLLLYNIVYGFYRQGYPVDKNEVIAWTELPIYKEEGE